MGLRDRTWKRFLRGPDQTLVADLYEPALSLARRYGRSCAYFSSTVLAVAARGFGPFIETLLALGDEAPKPAIRLVVNEELSREDVTAIIEGGDTDRLTKSLLARLTRPVDALGRDRLGMLAFLAQRGLLDIRVGLMRHGRGIVHAKYGIVTDEAGDGIVFMGSGNESASGLIANYEKLEVSTSWEDPERQEHYRTEFETLWEDRDQDVITLKLPEAVRLELIRYAHSDVDIPRRIEPHQWRSDRQRLEAAMRWRFAIEATFLPDGARSCDATALVGLWPHQGRVVEEAAAAWPTGSLLCDEVGMGKTVEAIMVLRRLLAGRGVQRVLLLAPAGLLKQWQEELREKGGLLVPRLDGPQALVWPDGTVERVRDFSEALERPMLLVSRELARLDQNAAVLLQSPPWDLVLLDEAHAARRAKQEEREFNSATLLLGLLRRLQLEGRARGLMLLSATPMQTHPWEPWDLLAVLGEGAPWLSEFAIVREFYQGAAQVPHGPVSLDTTRRLVRIVESDSEFPSPPVPFRQLPTRLAGAPAAERQKLARWLRRGAPLGRRMYRNTRATLRSYFDQGLIPTPPPKRAVQDSRFEYADTAERDLYDAITRYVNRRFEELEAERPGKGFVMTVYRRRATSSPFALEESLKRRADGLRRVTRQLATDPDVQLDLEDERDFDELFEGERRGRLSSALPEDPLVAARELQDVERLLAMLDALRGTDSKFAKFLTALRMTTDDGRPVLVFSEFADTIAYLRDQLGPSYGESLGCYTGDGGLVWGENGWTRVSKDEVTERLRRGDLRILLCTDAASEGLNLQAAGAVINYDLPWNPSRVEQRIGRIDRIGQRAEVVRIVNLVLADSVDDRVYQVLEERCGLFEQFVGPMQPVLAEARFMLLGLRPFDADLLREVEARVRADAAALEAFEATTESPPATKPPGMAGEHLVSAFSAVCPSGEVSVAGRQVRVGMSTEELEEDERALPLSPLLPELRRLSDELLRPGELVPLVVGAHSEGQFRAAVAIWVSSDGQEVLDRFERLEALLGMWDGRFVQPRAWIQAEEAAKKQAQELVRAMVDRAAQRERQGLERQVAVARLRLLREVCRYLLCLDIDAADLNQVFHTQRMRDIASAARLSRAYERVGYPEWDGAVVEELRQQVNRLSAGQRESVLLGKPLDAALDDPRWVALKTLEAMVHRTGRLSPEPRISAAATAPH